MIKTIIGIVSTLLFLGAFTYHRHEVMSVPHAPHSKVQHSIEEFIKTVQHGPNVKCKQLCAPEGFEDDVKENPEGLPVVTCAGNTNPEVSCARQGSQCGEEHRYGCAESCRDQCCTCCSI
jgi:hypothetical protein